MKTRTWVIAGVVLIAAAMVLISGGFAKYTQEEDGQGSVYAKMFYFTSDLLDGGTHILAPGTTELTFTIGNHEDQLRHAEMDVSYTLTVTSVSNGATEVSDSPVKIIAVRKGNEESSTSQSKVVDSVTADITAESSAVLSRTLALQSEDTHPATNETTEYSDVNILDDTITISGITSGRTYTITATGTSGTGEPAYKKTLTCVFYVQAEEPVVYKSLVTSNEEYVLLTVWTKNYTGDVKITLPMDESGNATVLPDNTDAVMKSWFVDTALNTAGDKNSFTDEKSFKQTDANTSGYASHVYRFFGSGVSVDNFTVTYYPSSSTGGATEKQAETGNLSLY